MSEECSPPGVRLLPLRLAKDTGLLPQRIGDKARRDIETARDAMAAELKQTIASSPEGSEGLVLALMLLCP
jgi:hypothetical protein